jgi:N utilization substance protein B
MATLRERLAQSDPPVPEYAAELVEGVVAHRERIDELLATYAEEWTLERMPPVDLAALRIGTYELLWCDDVPDGVAVSEAVALVASLSTDESAGFVNGLLGRLMSLKPSLAV